MNTIKSIKQAVIGCALGDSWGYPYEFSQKYGIDVRLQPYQQTLKHAEHWTGEENSLISDRIFNHVLKISDDTQMTLASLKATQEVILNDGFYARENISLFEDEFINYNFDTDNYRAPGITVTSSLDNLASHKIVGNPEQTMRNSHGCGSIMRFAPTAVLMPSDSAIGWTVLQALITHVSPESKATAAIAAGIINKFKSVEDVTEVSVTQTAIDMLNDSYGYIKNDMLLTDEEKNDVLSSMENSKVSLKLKDNIKANKSLADSLDYAHYNAPFIADAIKNGIGETSQLIDSENHTESLGQGWDSQSCLTVSIMLAEAFRILVKSGFDKYLATYYILYCSVGWDGDRDSRGAVTGALLGSLFGDYVQFEDILSDEELEFEYRYNDSIMNAYWNGFEQVTKGGILDSFDFKRRTAITTGSDAGPLTKFRNIDNYNY